MIPEIIPSEIQKVITEDINPTLAKCGGSVTALEYNGEELVVRLEGKCRGCLAQDETMTEIVERLLITRCTENPVKKVILSDRVDPELWAQAMKILQHKEN